LKVKCKKLKDLEINMKKWLKTMKNYKIL